MADPFKDVPPPIRKFGDEAIENARLLAENERLREALERIARGQWNKHGGPGFAARAALAAPSTEEDRDDSFVVGGFRIFDRDAAGTDGS